MYLNIIETKLDANSNGYLDYALSVASDRLVVEVLPSVKAAMKIHKIPPGSMGMQYLCTIAKIAKATYKRINDASAQAKRDDEGYNRMRDII